MWPLGNADRTGACRGRSLRERRNRPRTRPAARQNSTGTAAGSLPYCFQEHFGGDGKSKRILLPGPPSPAVDRAQHFAGTGFGTVPRKKTPDWFPKTAPVSIARSELASIPFSSAIWGPGGLLYRPQLVESVILLPGHNQTDTGKPLRDAPHQGGCGCHHR